LNTPEKFIHLSASVKKIQKHHYWRFVFFISGNVR
jgi:hypothetical protein